MTVPILRFAGLVLLCISAPGFAQPSYQAALDAAQAELAAVFHDLELNLTEKEGIEMQTTDWSNRWEAFKPRLDELNQRYEQLNAYCQGTYEEEEYNRRLAYCESTGSQLDTLKAQLEPERAGLAEQAQDLQRRDAAREQAGDAIAERLTPALTHLVTACEQIPLADLAALCRLPSAPGPRTQPIIDQMNAGLNAAAAAPE
jgi:predicted  nucleic acid-binding Zn-ribbon protein